MLFSTNRYPGYRFPRDVIAYRVALPPLYLALEVLYLIYLGLCTLLERGERETCLSNPFRGLVNLPVA